MSNSSSDGDISSAQVHIERNQKRARSNSNRSSAGMQHWLTNIWLACLVCFDVLSQIFEATLPHVFKSHSIGSHRRVFIKVSRYAKFSCDAPAGLMCKRHALRHRDFA